MAQLPQGVRLRDMTVHDVPAVHALERSLFPADAWPAQMFRDELSQPQTRRYYVVEEASGELDESVDGGAARIIGYAGVMCVPPIADVQTIAVVPEREGRGIGSAVLTELIAEAARRGARDVLLEVREDNPRAQALYRRFGFVHIHTRRRYYRDGVNALIMQLPLTRPGEGDK
ncbi:ribosomal protein S18-alanine N-acetyltransferase [Sinomonas sp.]|uniref:ribosomal protein S18-alanine N-acetyltransferase n=1 Tax=Sinomonas sp. TaxID=1914986 RepID=UPI002C888DDB|nr:ribosomal protein S18-alanine N-acetyltransferase [Sinomonas sp.]